MPNPLVAIISGGVGSLIGAIGGIIDDLNTSDEEKLAAKLALSKLENDITLRLIEAEQTVVREQAKVLVAEAQGESWLQRNWRPVTMMTFVFIVAWNHVVAPLTGVGHLPIPDPMWNLLQLGIGGYIIGRSVEKGIKTYTESKVQIAANGGPTGHNVIS
jgi:hypothetical protein